MTGLCGSLWRAAVLSRRAGDVATSCGSLWRAAVLSRRAGDVATSCGSRCRAAWRDTRFARLAGTLALQGTLALLCVGLARGDEPPAPVPAAATHAETMARMGLVRQGGAWRTAQEIELIERAEKAAATRREWKARLERLRRRLDVPAESAAAIQEIRGISDPLAVQPLVDALLAEPVQRVRGLYLEALGRIPAPDAFVALVTVALDHADPETRIAAVERLRLVGPHLALPPLVAALAGGDNPRVNRAAEALGRLGVSAAVEPLIGALETEHATVVSDGRAPGSTSATFTPAGGGLSMGGGPKKVKVRLRNEAVLEALIALTGVNFQWDQAAWRAWLANERSLPVDYDLRRG
jgi:HEAT repeat protein